MLPTAALAALSLALPSHDWSTVPRFVHCANESGPFNADAVAKMARVPIVTFEKFQGLNEAPAKAGAEHKIIEVAKQVKAAAGSRKVEVLMYYQIDFARTWYDSGSWFDAKPEYELHDNTSGALIVSDGWHIYDFSQQGARDKWVSTLTWAVGSGVIDGVFIDGLQGDACSAHGGYEFLEQVSAEKCAAWLAGTNETQWTLRAALGAGGTIIDNPVYYYHPSTSGAMIEGWQGTAANLALLDKLTKDGLLVEAHLATSHLDKFNVSLAAFLVGAGDQSYFGVGGWTTCDDWLVDYPEYSRPLGPPLGPATVDGTRYTRSFTEGTKVELDTGKGTNCIRWADGATTGNAC